MKSGVGTILRGLGYAFMVMYIIAGIILGTAFGTGRYGSDFNLPIAIGVWFVGATISALIFAIGTIVEQLNGMIDMQSSLDEIKNNLRVKKTPPEKLSPDPKANQNSMTIVRTHWECMRCHQQSTAEEKYCSHCGGKRAPDWKCTNCKSLHLAHEAFCHECGLSKVESDSIYVKRTGEKNKFDAKRLEENNQIDFDGIMNDIEKESDAAAICNYLNNYLEKTPNQVFSDLMKYIVTIVEFERFYGNHKKEALEAVRSFFDHKMQVFSLDQTKEMDNCPACGFLQKVGRSCCQKCGALFMNEVIS